jgi:hypothetical protein
LPIVIGISNRGNADYGVGRRRIALLDRAVEHSHQNGKAVAPAAKSDSQRSSRSMRKVMSLAIEKIIDISLELDPKNFGMRTPAGLQA